NFFFSSRRRHTRSKRVWSSDVCSSDLPQNVVGAAISRPPQFTVYPSARPDSRWIRRKNRPCGSKWTDGARYLRIHNFAGPAGRRSEERRVGKEHRSWWWRVGCKINKKK